MAPMGRGRSGGPGGGRGRGDDKKADGKKGQRRGLFRRRKVCKFCADKIDDINYKDVKLLSGFVPGARQGAAAANLGHLREASARTPHCHRPGAADRAAAVRVGLIGNSSIDPNCVRSTVHSPRAVRQTVDGDRRPHRQPN